MIGTTSEKKRELRIIARGVLSSVMSQVLSRIDSGEIELQENSKATAILLKEVIKDVAENLEVE